MHRRRRMTKKANTRSKQILMNIILKVRPIKLLELQGQVEREREKKERVEERTRMRDVHAAVLTWIISDNSAERNHVSIFCR